MLLSADKTNNRKQVAFLTRNPEVTRLLSAIVEAWGFTVVDCPEGPAVVFIERGLAEPEHAGKVVWLSPMPVNEPFLDIPVSLTELYHLLEETYFPSPRRHIRVTLEHEADLQVEGEWLPVELISLSDRGGRIRCDRELPRDQKVTLEVKLGERLLRLTACVLYTIPAGDSRGRERAQAGILFTPLDKDVCTALRWYIERCCVERACARSGFSIKSPALSWIALVSDPWAEQS